MPHPYPRPTALPEEVGKVMSLYRERYGVELGFDEAKKLLEGVAQFIYLTEVDREVEGAGAVRDPYTGKMGFAEDGNGEGSL